MGISLLLFRKQSIEKHSSFNSSQTPIVHVSVRELPNKKICLKVWLKMFLYVPNKYALELIWAQWANLQKVCCKMYVMPYKSRYVHEGSGTEPQNKSAKTRAPKCTLTKALKTIFNNTVNQKLYQIYLT